MRILVFLHGTTIMHAGGLGATREERVEQVRSGEASVADFVGYVPISNAAAKLRRWHEAGAEISYLSSHRRPEDVRADEEVLRRFGFPAGPVLFRGPGATYRDVAVRARPDVIVEDDCESIGGVEEMTHPQLPAADRRRVASIVVREFEGIDRLPDDPRRLLEQSAGNNDPRTGMRR